MTTNKLNARLAKLTLQRRTHPYVDELSKCDIANDYIDILESIIQVLEIKARV